MDDEGERTFFERGELKLNCFELNCFVQVFCKMCLLIIKNIDYYIYKCQKNYLTQNYTQYTLWQQQINVYESNI